MLQDHTICVPVVHREQLIVVHEVYIVIELSVEEHPGESFMETRQVLFKGESNGSCMLVH